LTHSSYVHEYSQRFFVLQLQHSEHMSEHRERGI